MNQKNELFSSFYQSVKDYYRKSYQTSYLSLSFCPEFTPINIFSSRYFLYNFFLLTKKTKDSYKHQHYALKIVVFV
jgi:hypothetical protein